LPHAKIVKTVGTRRTQFFSNWLSRFGKFAIFDRGPPKKACGKEIWQLCRMLVVTSEKKRSDVLPASLPPRGLNRFEAAAYIGLSPSKFDDLVHDGRMPKPKRIDGRVIWDRVQLDNAFTALPNNGENAEDPWGSAAV
jgi:predicted DNA-binding transcriptional regulator AlpA